MAEFTINTDIVTDTPTVEVTITTDKPLAIGRHTFRLIVVDDSGNRSLPDEVTIIVTDQTAPTAVLKAPSSVASGTSFNLDGRQSIDSGGGRVVQYIWTYLGPNLSVPPVVSIPISPTPPIGIILRVGRGPRGRLDCIARLNCCPS